MIGTILILVALIILSAIMSASETALTSVSRFNVEYFLKNKTPGSALLSKLKQNPHRMLSTLLIMNNFVNISASVIATDLALKTFDHNALAIATGGMTFVLLTFGEILPKNFAASHSKQFALLVTPLVYFLNILLFPITWLFTFLTQKILRIPEPRYSLTEEEFKNIVDMAHKEGGIDYDESELIHKIFTFDDIYVSEIMTPRLDIEGIEKTATFDYAIALFKKTQYSRIPVFDKSADKIVGVLYIKDALMAMSSKAKKVSIQKIMREPYFVPETKKLDHLLKDFQNTNQQIAIVVDEHGGVSGIVTMEDVIEEIVGEIHDETDTEQKEIQRIGKNQFKIAGKTSIATITRRLKIHIPEQENYDTISGFVMHELGKIPQEGTEIQKEQYTLHVKKVQKNRIVELLIIKK